MTTPSTDFSPCLEGWDPIFCCVIPTGAAAVSGNLLGAATETLWQAGGQRYGLCTLTVRPCREECFSGANPWMGGGWPGGEWYQWQGGMWPRPLLYAGAWFNIACGSCPGSCNCGSQLSAVKLPPPIYSIIEIKIDGTVLPTGSYTVIDNQRVIRTDGGLWPQCQDLTQPDTADNTWSITFTDGEEVPELGRLALGELLCEYARAFCGDDCRLPKNVQSLVRQGVTISYPADQDWLERLFFAKQYLDYANPNRLYSAPRVYNIDDLQPTRWGT